MSRLLSRVDAAPGRADRDVTAGVAARNDNERADSAPATSPDGTTAGNTRRSESLALATTPSGLPPGYTTEEGPDGITITNRWSGPLPLVGAAVAVILALRVDLLRLNDVMGTNPFEGGFFYTTRVGAAMAVALVYCWFERTVYTVNAGHVSVRRLPFFWFGDCTVGTADIERLEVVVTKSRESTSAHHTLLACLRDGSRRALIRDFASREFPEYLRSTIERSRQRPGKARRIDAPASPKGLARFLPALAMAIIAVGFLRPFGPEKGAEAKELRRLGAEVVLRGGRVVVDFSHKDLRPNDLDHLRGVARLGEVSLFGASVGDEGLRPLAGLSGLRKLNLGLNPVSDAGLESLRGLARLEALDLGGCAGVGDDGMEHLKGLSRLRTLNLASTGITDAGLARLARLAALETINLSYTAVTDAGVQALRQALPRATIIRSPAR